MAGGGGGDLEPDCKLGMGHPGSKSIADTFLGTRWSAALPLWLLIGWELPEECIAACLWKAEATTSGSLIADKVAIVVSLKKKGMEQECKKEAHNSGFLSSASFIPPLLLCQPSLILSIIQSPSIPSSPFSLSLMQVAFPCLLHICDGPRARARGSDPSKSGSPENVTCLTLTRLNIKNRRQRGEVNPWSVCMWARQHQSCCYREKEEGYGTDKSKTTFCHVCT